MYIGPINLWTPVISFKSTSCYKKHFFFISSKVSLRQRKCSLFKVSPGARAKLGVPKGCALCHHPVRDRGSSRPIYAGAPSWQPRPGRLAEAESVSATCTRRGRWFSPETCRGHGTKVIVNGSLAFTAVHHSLVTPSASDDGPPGAPRPRCPCHRRRD